KRARTSDDLDLHAGGAMAAKRTPMTTRTVATISMCGGTLTAFVRHEYLPYYTPASQMLDEHDGHRFWLVFERGGEPTEIDTPEQLLATLNAQGCDVQAEVVPVLARFVELLA